jgi:hypothetical protein
MHNNYFELNYRDRQIGSVANLKFFGRTVTYQNVFSKTVRANLFRKMTAINQLPYHVEKCID